jgi:membrane protease YdiL (CAAX protease family)
MTRIIGPATVGSTMSVSNDAGSPLLAVGSATFLGIVGLFVGVLLSNLGFLLLSAFVTIRQGSALSNALALVATGAGLFAVGAVYLSFRDLDVSYVRVGWPSLRDVGWAVAGTVALFVVLGGLSYLVQELGLSATDHAVAEAGRENPALLLPLIPLSVLVTGPAEEFLYRGIVQTRLREAFDVPVAVLAAAAVFGLVHAPAYGLTQGVGWSLVTTLAILFVLGGVLGAAYEYSGNLVVPAIAHGVYNAVVFGQLYVEAAGVL